MASQIIPIVWSADEQLAVGLRYDDVTMVIASIGVVNKTDRSATITMLHVPSGVSRSRTIPASFSGVKALTDGWIMPVDDNGKPQFANMSMSISLSPEGGA